jgi:hypothetical protein
MALLTIVPPAVEPVTLDELKEFMGVSADDNSEDRTIASLGIAARQWCEVHTQRRFITQRIRLLMDFFPGYVDMKLAGQKVSSPFVSGSNAVLVGIRYAITLPYPKVQSIETFTFLNANGTETSMFPDVDFIADLSAQPARLTPLFGKMWPVSRVVVNAVKIEYNCGYGDDPSSVPEGIKTAIKLLATHWKENRLPDESNIHRSVKAILSPFRDMRF